MTLHAASNVGRGPAGLTLDAIEAALAEKKLRHFIRVGWPHIDKADFIGNWHIDAIADHLEAVIRGEIRRLMIMMPPRHMKSTGASVALPAWTWLQSPSAEERRTTWLGPSTQFFYTSYAQSVSNKDSVKCRRLIQSKWYQRHWGERFGLSRDQNAKSRFDNDKQGYRIATALNAMTTGDGGDILVVDDAHNVKQAESELVRLAALTAWDESLSTRLNNPARGAFIVIGQRVKEDDLCGHILDAEGNEWVVLCLPARFEKDHPLRWKGDPRTADGELLWPERIPMATLNAMEKTMGPFAVAGQMQQRPAPREGGMFKRAWFEGKMIESEDVPRGTVWVRHWDLAATELKATDTKSARTIGLKMGRMPNGAFVVGSMIARGQSGATIKKLIRDQAAVDGPGCIVSLPQDPGQAGKVQKSEFGIDLAGYRIKVKQEQGDKIQRAQPFADQCELGNVYVVRGNWNNDFFEELCMFPGGKRKDVADGCSGAFQWLVVVPEAEPLAGAPICYAKEKVVEGYE